MRQLPPLNALRVFDAAARQSNFSVAAEELCVTHSAVSHQIRQLEDWTGQPLFVRHAGGVRLTPAGQALQKAVEEALSLLENACALARSAPVTEIVLGAPGSFLANWLIPRLEHFEAAHPDLRIRLQTCTDLEELLKQRVDALIVSGHHWPRAIAATPLFEEKIGPVHASNWPSPPRQSADLRGQALLQTSSHPQAWPEWANQQQIDMTQWNIARQFDHLSLMLEAAAAGIGIAIAPEILVEGEISRQRLVAPLGFVACGAVFAFCTQQKRQTDAGLATLREWLTEQA